MNYKQMLDQFEFLESKLAHLENETKYLKERVAYLEGSFLANKSKPPGFTPDTLPEVWPNIPPGQFWSSSKDTTYSGARQ